MKLHIIVTICGRTTHLKRLIFDMQLQTNPWWDMVIIHDGPVIKDLYDFVTNLEDPRITFKVVPQAKGHYGFPNRKQALADLKGDEKDFVLITNDDNQYLPVFIEYFLAKCNDKVGFVYCNCIHSYLQYEILNTQINVGYIDMGSFIVRLDIAKDVNFSSFEECADGIYAEECAMVCYSRKLKIVGIRKALFIHN